MAFGIWDVEQWLDEITWTQLSRWLSFFRRMGGPPTPKRDDLRFGQLAALIANANFTRENKQPFEAGDFFPSLREDVQEPVRKEQQPMDKEEWREMLSTWGRAVGVVRKVDRSTLPPIPDGFDDGDGGEA